MVDRPGRMGPWYRLAVVTLTPPVRMFTRRRSSGMEHLPPGGVIVAVNHISHTDPIVLADWLLQEARRIPRFMAKSTLFRHGTVVGAVMRGADQIPVLRDAPDASLALVAAVDALARGELIAIYPEGTVSRDPDKWPMLARTGVARLALLSGAPVVPVAQWGAQRVHDTYRSRRVHLLPRTTVSFRVGPPVNLTRWQGRPLSADVLHDATGAVLDAITAELEVLRGEPAPAQRFDPRPGRRAARQDRRSA